MVRVKKERGWRTRRLRKDLANAGRNEVGGGWWCSTNTPKIRSVLICQVACRLEWCIAAKTERQSALRLHTSRGDAHGRGESLWVIERRVLNQNRCLDAQDWKKICVTHRQNWKRMEAKCPVHRRTTDNVFFHF